MNIALWLIAGIAAYGIVSIPFLGMVRAAGHADEVARNLRARRRKARARLLRMKSHHPA